MKRLNLLLKKERMQKPLQKLLKPLKLRKKLLKPLKLPKKLLKPLQRKLQMKLNRKRKQKEKNYRKTYSMTKPKRKKLIQNFNGDKKGRRENKKRATRKQSLFYNSFRTLMVIKKGDAKTKKGRHENK